MKSIIKIFSEIIPLIIFFYLYKKYDIKFASIGLSIATILSLFVNYMIEKKISKTAILSTIIVTISTCLTVFTGNSNFIKMKPTIIYLIFAFVIFVSLYYKSNLIKNMLNKHIELSDDIIKKLSIIWGVFFLCLAFLNEFIWRNFSENTWVKFKVFGILPIILLFMIIQISFLYKNFNKK
jgi:intracellular septation protein